jgi:hypothetical protein
LVPSEWARRAALGVVARLPWVKVPPPVVATRDSQGIGWSVAILRERCDEGMTLLRCANVAYKRSNRVANAVTSAPKPRGLTSVEVRPGFGAVELAHPHAVDGRRFEVACVDAHPGVGRWVERFPMRGAAADLAMHGADGAWAPDVFRGVLWMAAEYYRFSLVESPECPDFPANRAVAIDEILGFPWDADPDGAAVA